VSAAQIQNEYNKSRSNNIPNKIGEIIIIIIKVETKMKKHN